MRSVHRVSFLFLIAMAGCSSSATHTTETVDSGGGGMPAGCWSGPSGCDPVHDTGCNSSEQCGFNGTSFLCLAATPNAPGAGQPCEAVTNFCASGSICDQTDVVCRKVCCVASDCPPTETCVPFGPPDTMGFCMKP